jgi:RimJ/RimL family protein N-acetyltransferase
MTTEQSTAGTTERLTLRRPDLKDLDFVVRLFSLPELVAHRPDPTPDLPEASRHRLERDIEHWDRLGYGRWAVEANGKIIGFGGATFSEPFQAIILSYHLHPLHWGKGYAGEIVGAAVQFAFAKLNAERIMGLARPANPASCRVLERAGLRFEREVQLHGAPTRLYSLSTVTEASPKR